MPTQYIGPVLFALAAILLIIIRKLIFAGAFLVLAATTMQHAAGMVHSH